MNDTYGIGIIGCGNISTTYIELGRLFRRLDFRACADMNPDAAIASARKYGLRALSVEELLASDDIDIVVNLTIPEAHVAVSRQILEAGKHVYSEKPLALSVADGKALADLAGRRNLRIGCAPDTFLGGAHQQARGRVDSGAIGAVVSGSCHVMSHGMEHWHPNPDFFFLPGAGPVLDLGPYYIANMVHLIGPVKRVVALTSAATPTRTITSQPRAGETIPVKTPTNVHALLDFANGATITFSASWDVWAHEHSPIEIYGTEGSMFVPDPNFFGGTIRAAGRDGQIAPLPASKHPFAQANYQEGAERRANFRSVGLADMAAAIADNRDHRCSLELAVHAVDVMLSILKSGETGRFVEMTTTCGRPAAIGSEEAAGLLVS